MLPHPETVLKLTELRDQQRQHDVAQQRHAASTKAHKRSRPTKAGSAQLAGGSWTTGWMARTRGAMRVQWLHGIELSRLLGLRATVQQAVEKGLEYVLLTRPPPPAKATLMPAATSSSSRRGRTDPGPVRREASGTRHEGWSSQANRRAAGHAALFQVL
jgi:hypothetical protein